VPGLESPLIQPDRFGSATLAGEPPYGRGCPPSFAPIMRQTNAVIDQAGNVWTINNYKPDFDIDVLSNPGGDGIVIFVGLAAPRTKSH
jgi:hypothetical protein